MKKCVIYRKKSFYENIDNEVVNLLKESFKIDYFLYIIDQTIIALRNRFEQLKYMKIFLVFHLALRN